MDKQAAAARARAAVMEVERSLGYTPKDRETEKLGYDIESHDPRTGRLRFIEVKGRMSGADSVTVTKNEILYFFNKPEESTLAIVEFETADSSVFTMSALHSREPYFGVTSVNYDFAESTGAGRGLPMTCLVAHPCGGIIVIGPSTDNEILAAVKTTARRVQHVPLSIHNVRTRYCQMAEIRGSPE